MKVTSYKKETFNWGEFPKLKAEVFLPNNFSEIASVLSGSNTYISRGNGRCYGDANLSQHSISTQKLNHFISFDREKGIIHAESGVLLSDILEVAVPVGFFLPITPGTKFITLGGALAADVHGKNHHLEGCFSDHVLSYTLIDDKGAIHVLYPDQDEFWITPGCMGLNGVILDVKIQLKKIESAYIKYESLKAKNLDEIFRLFEESENYTYTVAWIDCLQKGNNMGRSILFRGEHAKLNELPNKFANKPLFVNEKKKFTVPFYFPNFALNSFTVKAFNFLYYHKQFQSIKKGIIDYDTFFYPLDTILEWNKIYGKQGFIQYQFVLPKISSRKGMGEILKEIQTSGQGSFLAVLKLFGKNNPKAKNVFPIEGYTLALDFKMNESLPDLVKKLDHLVKKYHGRIYRAKDSMSDSALLDYIDYPSNNKFSSIQEERISNS